MKLQTLEAWALARYGVDAPAAVTLRRWARGGHIFPAPKKHGRAYFVSPDANYVELTAGRPHRRLVERMHVPASPQRP